MSDLPRDARMVVDLIATRARDVCDGYGATVAEFDGMRPACVVNAYAARHRAGGP